MTYDIVLFGATGFTGQQAAERLAPHVGELRLAVAGRNREKLEALRARLPNAGDVGLIVADGLDAEAVDAMVRQARVVVSTAGPFALYSDAVVAACARHGRDYLDITGESPWVRSLIDRHHAVAREAGARIIPLCGLDSIPADVGAWMMARHIRRRQGQGTRRVTGYVSLRGGLNGGTAVSALGLLSPEGLEALHDPVLLNPPSHRSDAARARNPDQRRARFDPDLDAWTAPSLTAPVNTRVVRRSAALSELAGAPYGEDFRYHECLSVKNGLAARAVAAGYRAFEAVATRDMVRRLLLAVAPEPGEGPSDVNAGYLRYVFIGEAEDGQRTRGLFYAEGDPSNAVTVSCLTAAALALTLDRDALPDVHGVLTPAFALGDALVERLQGQGVRLAIED